MRGGRHPRGKEYAGTHVDLKVEERRICWEERDQQEGDGWEDGTMISLKVIVALVLY